MLDNRPKIGTVYSVGVSTIAVRLFSTGTIIEDVPVAGGGVLSLAPGDPVWLLYFDEDNSVLAFSAKAVVGGEFVGGAPSAHTHPALYYTKGEMDALLLTKEDKATNKTPQWIEAIGGSIGGWLIEADRLIKDTGTAATSAGMVPADYPFYAGAIYDNRASAPFRVTPAGAITATSGIIGGWTLGTTTLSATGIILDAGNQKITVGSAAPNMEIDGANKRIRTSTYAAGLQGFNLDGATGDAEFNNISARGALKVTTLQYGQILATNGSVIVPRATGVVRDDFATVLPGSGLLAYWNMEEATGAARVDSVASMSLSVNGTVSQVGGKVSNAAGAIGSANYLSVTDNATMSTGDIDFSFACWVYLTTKTADRIVFSKTNAETSSGIEYVLQYSLSDDRLLFRVSSGTVQTPVTWSASPSTETWYFVVCWHDSVNNVIGIQVNDGTPVTAAHSAGVQDSAFAFEVFRAFAAKYGDGRVDELAFTKRLWTAAEKTALYNGGAGVTYPLATTVAVNIKNAEGLSHAANGGLWAVDDIVRIKEPLAGDFWGKVISKVDNTTYWTLNIDKQSPPGSADYTFYKGVAILNYGQSGQGFLYLTADDVDGPFYSVRTHAGSPWTAQTEMGRFGNMRNSFGVGANNYYGFGVGDYAAGNYLRYNPTNGFSLVSGNGGVTIDSVGLTIAGGILAVKETNFLMTLDSSESGSDAVVTFDSKPIAGKTSTVTLKSVAPSTYRANLHVRALSGSTTAGFEIGADSDGSPTAFINSYGDLLPIGAGTYNLGNSGNYFDSVYCNTFPRGANFGTATGAAAGEIRTSGSLITSGQSLLQYASNRLTIANNGVAQLPLVSGNGAGTNGFVFIFGEAANAAIYMLNGGGNNTQEMSDPSNTYSPTAGTASSTNVYWSSGNNRYEIENKTGAERTYDIWLQVL